ncbi:MAG: hypothetical protein JXR49_22940, partial [Acidobacteria bacterium]|nr:hypothetical protein [Acidobacteriota bacterium]
MLNGIALLFLGAAMAATPCENLTDLKLADATITGAAAVAEGPPPKAGMFGRGAPQANLPAYCRVQLDLRPSSDSLIKMELWLPTQNWNGKFMGTGNGFFAGSIQAMAFDMPE